MTTFLVGDEVRYDGRRYVVSTIDESRPKPYRLMRTTPTGVQFAFATHDQLKRVAVYTTPVDDTAGR